jgi:carboxymethylenebutenolidase
MNSVNQSEADEEFSAVLQALEKPGRKLATMGWSFGGTESFQATMVAPEKVSATVMYYPFGKIIKSGNNLNSLNSPILMIRARVDSPETIEETTHFIHSLKKSGKSISEVTYEARHGFANPEVRHYDKTASEAAWAKARNFLDKYLR